MYFNGNPVAAILQVEGGQSGAGGLNAKYDISTPGWKRILNLIRVSNGTLNIGLAKARYSSGYSCQAFCVDLAGNVNFPISATKTQPVIYQRFNHEFGENNSEDETRRARVTQVRIGYPKEGATYPEAEGSVNYETNPVNCYVDIYVDFEPQFEGDTIQLTMNYSGFADSHNCEPIIEETDALATGMYGEELEFYALTLNKNATLYMPDGSIVAKSITQMQKYELLEEIVLTEDTQQVVRDKKPDGTPYNLSALRVYIWTPSIGNQTIYFRTDDADGGMISFHNLPYEGVQADNRLFFRAENNRGLCDFRVAAGCGAVQVQEQIRMDSGLYKSWKNISKLTIGAGTNTTLAATVVIKILGVQETE